MRAPPPPHPHGVSESHATPGHDCKRRAAQVLDVSLFIRFQNFSAHATRLQKMQLVASESCAHRVYLPTECVRRAARVVHPTQPLRAHSARRTRTAALTHPKGQKDRGFEAQPRLGPTAPQRRNEPGKNKTEKERASELKILRNSPGKKHSMRKGAPELQRAAT